MQKRTRCAVLCLALCLVLSSQAGAASPGIGVAVNGTVLETAVPGEIYNQVTYVHYWPIITALYPNATSNWSNGVVTIQADGLTMRIRPGAQYLEANGRYLYMSNGARMAGDICMIPATALAWALNGSAWWDTTSGLMQISSGSGAIQPGDSFYDSTSVYWLSRIINAESGNQPLQGKIAVGNVILNRVASPMFPNTVYDVIFQGNQFTPAMTGAVNREPNAESVVAAKLCLEGAQTASNALYFVNPHVSPNSWASRNRPYVATIGAHSFFA